MKEHQTNIVNLEGEIWKPVVGYEGLYEVSNMGRVKSCARSYTRVDGATITLKEKLFQQCKNVWGYPMCNLWKNKIKKNIPVHRIVATTFIPNLENKRTVNHKNGIRDDNRLDNLEWATYSEQHIHAFEKLGRVNSQQGKTGELSASFRAVLQIDRITGEIISKFNGAKEAERETGICASTIGYVARKVFKHAGNYIWVFEDDELDISKLLEWSNTKVKKPNNFPLKRGSGHPRAKLTEQQVLQIRDLYSKGVKMKELTVHFAATFSMISSVVTRKNWKHI
jgi:hypothetical protein